MTRDEAKAMAERLGAKVQARVAEDRHLRPGRVREAADAKKHGVAVLSEDDWFADRRQVATTPPLFTGGPV
jgi:DNA ligase (NAD+)